MTASTYFSLASAVVMFFTSCAVGVWYSVEAFTFPSTTTTTYFSPSPPLCIQSSHSSYYSSSSSSLFAAPQNDELSRGDARGAALRLEEVSVSRGSSQILSDLNWRIEPKSKWALVGTNGCGKSTLLKAIMEEIPYEGAITVGTTQKVGYLQQTAVAGSTKTILDEAKSAMQDIEQARQALEKAESMVAENANPTDDQLTALDNAMKRFEQAGGYTQEQEVSSLLQGLGFTNLTQTCDELSGGWQMRVSFAKLLLSKPTLCLLDEPGNHLDRSARRWLAQYLKDYQGGAMVLVTHDVELLEAMDHIAEISAGTLQQYKSVTYSQYVDQKEARRQAAVAEYEKNLEKAAKLQKFVDQWGASATKASAAQSRVKQLEKMKQQGSLDAPPETVLLERFKPRLVLPDPPKSMGEILLELKNADIGYHTAAANAAGEDDKVEAKPLLSNVDFEIRRGMKILIRGPNGSGKTTLLDTLRGTLPLMGGERIPNSALRLGVFTQDLAQELDPKARSVDLVTAYARDGYDITISDKDARTVMGGLGLQGDKSLRKIEALSGGEKARVALAMFALKPSNLYLLDEVSNHLDIEWYVYFGWSCGCGYCCFFCASLTYTLYNSVEALSESLSDWGDETGSIVVISHDKTFCDKVGFTHVVTVQTNGSLLVEQRGTRDSDWDSSIDTLQRSSSSLSEQDVVVDGNDGEVAAATTPPLDPKLRKQAYNAPKRIAKIEGLVEDKEAAIALLEDEMLANGSDVGKLVDLTNEKEALEAQVMELMEEWEELETLLSRVAA